MFDELFNATLERAKHDVAAMVEKVMHDFCSARRPLAWQALACLWKVPGDGRLPVLGSPRRSNAVGRWFFDDRECVSSWRGRSVSQHEIGNDREIAIPGREVDVRAGVGKVMCTMKAVESRSYIRTGSCGDGRINSVCIKPAWGDVFFFAQRLHFILHS